MSPQVSLAATASALALVALCLHAPALEANGAERLMVAPVASVIAQPSAALPHLLPR